ncbi:MAG: hypothetical protein N2385_14690 [Chloroflexus sp.]|nr:hypothetical protein [Chloroflexus sp.]
MQLVAIFAIVKSLFMFQSAMRIFVFCNMTLTPFRVTINLVSIRDADFCFLQQCR